MSLAPNATTFDSCPQMRPFISPKPPSMACIWITLPSWTSPSVPARRQLSNGPSMALWSSRATGTDATPRSSHSTSWTMSTTCRWSLPASRWRIPPRRTICAPATSWAPPTIKCASVRPASRPPAPSTWPPLWASLWPSQFSSWLCCSFCLRAPPADGALAVSRCFFLNQNFLLFRFCVVAHHHHHHHQLHHHMLLRIIIVICHQHQHQLR